MGLSAEEFKRLNPEQKHLEGNELWDAMADYQFKVQQREKIILKTKPFFQRYQLRWLFYVRKQNIVFGNNDYKSNKRCSLCKGGTGGLRMIIMNMEDMKSSSSPCPHCGKELIEEPNTSFTHRLYKFYRSLLASLIYLLDYLHLVRYSVSGRYELFGDESMFVKSTKYDSDWNYVKTNFRKRKWWQYIFIPRR